MIIPWRVDVPMERLPIMNWVIIFVTVVAFVLEFRLPEEVLESFILDGWDQPAGYVGHLFLHSDIYHLVGNMIFLLTFGNAICAKVGNFRYLAIYLMLGLAAAFAHLVFDGHPALGASGAINGIVGMYVVWYPINSITCFFVFFPFVRRFTVDSFWMVLFWLFFDILGLVLGFGGVAYWAHVGGFLAGFGIAIVLLLLKWVITFEYEKSLLEIWGWKGPKMSAKQMEEIDAETEGWTVIPEKESEEPMEIAQEPSMSEPSGADTFRGPPQESGQPSVRTTEPEQTHGEETKGFVRFQCSCGKVIKAPVKLAGKKGRCPRCAKKIVVPTQ